MADIGTVTGIIGSITGTVALIVSIKNSSRVSAMKCIDLRLELEKSYNELDVALSGLEGYLAFVRQSHHRVFSVTGRNLEGEVKLFEDDFAKDKQRLRDLLSSQPRRELSYVGRSTAELEQLIASVHACYLQAAELRKKYQDIFKSDEERRKEIRAQRPH